ncbi:MAG TPA: crosslink repair DNA glycosylase YcaQ family protein [Parafilimonas sp.]|nr:crosslink repair DNA glycosylase YcaQ family protein [Parafilimonas sp.]
MQAQEYAQVYIMMHAELKGIVCSGKRRDNQFTYALPEEIVGKSNPFNKEEALAELAKRYLQSRSPATIKDFSTWSGLTIKECTQGIEIQGSHLEKMILEKMTIIFFL